MFDGVLTMSHNINNVHLKARSYCRQKWKVKQAINSLTTSEDKLQIMFTPHQMPIGNAKKKLNLKIFNRDKVKFWETPNYVQG